RIAVQADLAIAIEVFVFRIADTDVRRHALQLLIGIELRLGADQPIEYVAEIRIDGVALTDVVEAQHIRVLSAIVDDLVLGIAERYARRVLQSRNLTFPSQ